MRWYISENKKRIASTNFEGHKDDVEMSGESVSGLIFYGVEKGMLTLNRLFIYPNFRIQPDVTQSSYKVETSAPTLFLDGEEKFVRVELDGVLSIYTRVGDLEITRRFYPSTTLPIFYEQIELFNGGKAPITPTWTKYVRTDKKLGCEGWIYAERIADKEPQTIGAGLKVTVTFGYSARFVNSEIPSEQNPLEKRRKRVEELLSVCDLTTGDEVLDTAFAFAKIRAGESIFRTRKGRVHSPGGTNYYAAVWCNDQSEYSTPWFAYTGDVIAQEAVKNAMDWYAPYMNDDYDPMPSSIISEGTDYWNGVGDRGDASMYLYGNSRYYLIRGELPSEKHAKMLAWCAEYISRKMTEEGIVVSDTDELENRLSSGINLSTSCLSYGAFGHYATLLLREGKKAEAEKIIQKREKIKRGIEKYFACDVSGYPVYQYHKDCKEIRSWICLPPYMGITERAEAVAKAIDEKLWTGGSCRSTEGENIMWDRSAIYYITMLFRIGKTEQGLEKLREYAKNRLLGERVPYAVEAYPEYNMRHLSAESALLCRIITDGLFHIRLTESGFSIQGKRPTGLEKVTLRKVWICGGYKDLEL